MKNECAVDEAKERLLAAIAYGNDDHRWSVRPATEAAIDQLILAVQQQSAQEIEKLKKNLAEMVKAEAWYRANEQMALHKLSDALTGGAAGTWDQVFVAAESAEARLREAERVQGEVRARYEGAKAEYHKVWAESEDKRESDYDEGRMDAYGAVLALIESIPPASPSDAQPKASGAFTTEGESLT